MITFLTILLYSVTDHERLTFEIDVNESVLITLMQYVFLIF